MEAEGILPPRPLPTALRSSGRETPGGKLRTRERQERAPACPAGRRPRSSALLITRQRLAQLLHLQLVDAGMVEDLGGVISRMAEVAFASRLVSILDHFIAGAEG